MDTSCEMVLNLDCKERINDQIYRQDEKMSYESQDLEWEFEGECKLKMCGTHLGEDSPIILYFGENGELLWHGLQQTKSRLVYFSKMPSSISSFYQLVEKAADYVFDYLSNSGVYIVGHGIGTLLVTKLLSNKDFFTRSYNSNKIQAVFLVSGIYNSVIQSGDRNHIDEPSWLSFDKMKNLESIIESINGISPLFDNYDHLLQIGVRLYVFSANEDEPQLKAQSRQMFDRFAEFCDQDDLHFEIKEKFDRNKLLVEMCKPNNFLGRLIRYDMCLSQSR